MSGLKIEANTGQREFNVVNIIMLILCGGAIYTLPYLRFGLWNSMMENMHFTYIQLGTIGAVYGASTLPSYFVGGMVADRFSPRSLMIFSMLATGCLGLYFSTFPGYVMSLIIHSLWGATTIVTFWSAYQALTRRSAPPEHQGKIFGLVLGGRSFLYCVLSASAVWLASQFTDPADGLMTAIIFLSVFHILVALGFVLFWTAPKSSAGDEADSLFKFADLKTVLNMRPVYLLGLHLFFTYNIMRLGDVFTPFGSSEYGLNLSDEVAGYLGVLKTYGMCPIGGIFVILFADKVGKLRYSGLMMLCAGFSMIGLITMSYEYTGIAIFFILFTMFAGWSCFALIFSMMDDANVPNRLTGTFVGVFSTLGFTSEVTAPYIGGYLLQNYPGVAGYHYAFKIMVVLCFINVIAYYFTSKVIKPKKAKIVQP